MFKLVVLFALLAVAAASVAHAPLAYTAGYAVPSAVSYQARTDVISKPIVATTYAAAAPILAAPAAVSYTAPVLSAPVASGYVAPALISSYSAPAVVKSAVAW